MTDSDVIPFSTRSTVEDFLYAEAALLDRHNYAAWLELFTPDGLYWVPAGGQNADPDSRVSIIYDDHARLAERIWRLESGLAYAQEPRSETAHSVTNVRVGQADDGEIEVNAVLSVAEWRRGRQSLYTGYIRYLLRPSDDGLRIALRRVDLINRNDHLGNMSFII